MRTLEYWYIWYEITENGERVSTGRYPRSYRDASGAKKRAIKLWGIDLYSAIPGTNFKRRWIISKTNPF